MYSMILMAALTTGGAAPDCHFRCGCYGGCYGCWGGCYGGCYGWGGCYGGCYGWGGCYGGGGWGGCYGCWGGYSSWGCGGYYGAPVYSGAPVMPSTGGGPGAGSGEKLPKPAADKDGTMAPSRAKLIVELPTDAKLYIDDLPMKTISGVRTFNTPELERGQSYYYMVRAEVVRDGKPITQTRRVIVRAGQTARANFKDMEAEAVTTARAK